MSDTIDYFNAINSDSDSDNEATETMIERFGTLPLKELHKFNMPERNKHSKMAFLEVVKIDPKYAKWVLTSTKIDDRGTLALFRHYINRCLAELKK